MLFVAAVVMVSGMNQNAVQSSTYYSSTLNTKFANNDIVRLSNDGLHTWLAISPYTTASTDFTTICVKATEFLFHSVSPDDIIRYQTDTTDMTVDARYHDELRVAADATYGIDVEDFHVDAIQLFGASMLATHTVTWEGASMISIATFRDKFIVGTGGYIPTPTSLNCGSPQYHGIRRVPVVGSFVVGAFSQHPSNSGLFGVVVAVDNGGAARFNVYTYDLLHPGLIYSPYTYPGSKVASTTLNPINVGIQQMTFDDTGIIDVFNPGLTFASIEDANETRIVFPHKTNRDAMFVAQRLGGTVLKLSYIHKDPLLQDHHCSVTLDKDPLRTFELIDVVSNYVDGMVFVVTSFEVYMWQPRDGYGAMCEVVSDGSQRRRLHDSTSVTDYENDGGSSSTTIANVLIKPFQNTMTLWLSNNAAVNIDLTQSCYSDACGAGYDCLETMTSFVCNATVAEIQTLATDLSTINAALATHTSDIATNTADITTNEGDITTNTAGLVTNSDDDSASDARLETYLVANNTALDVRIVALEVVHSYVTNTTDTTTSYHTMTRILSISSLIVGGLAAVGTIVLLVLKCIPPISGSHIGI